ncbi:MAG: D-tyrosyl-tRNA(Tyr) deacylase [Chloroflexi bacterium RBG_16_48_7]|nr:MAG: D-tyrosyl-tRNA(Tyr) deacylase [Chloroflexi bacterium RBG_16_48_7]
MKALIQRVNRASVTVDGEIIGRIDNGLLVLVGIAGEDTDKDIAYLTDKIVNLRIFSDVDGKFNLSVIDAGGSILMVSQFTLLADTRKGRRPGFSGAAAPEKAVVLFNDLVAAVKRSGIKVETGRFQEHMVVELVNDGPVTIMIDSADRLRPRD